MRWWSHTRSTRTETQEWNVLSLGVKLKSGPKNAREPWSSLIADLNLVSIFFPHWSRSPNHRLSGKELDILFSVMKPTVALSWSVLWLYVICLWTQEPSLGENLLAQIIVWSGRGFEQHPNTVKCGPRHKRKDVKWWLCKKGGCGVSVWLSAFSIV